MQKLDKQIHIHCVEGDVGRYCILPGDPGRCKAIAAHFDGDEFTPEQLEKIKSFAAFIKFEDQRK